MKLKEYLHTSGIKQNFIANKAGISPVTFSLYVLGKKIPNIETAWKIHIATNGEVTFEDWLLEEVHINADTDTAKDKQKNQVTRPSKK